MAMTTMLQHELEHVGERLQEAEGPHPVRPRAVLNEGRDASLRKDQQRRRKQHRIDDEEGAEGRPNH
jgi:hypothetical protein